MKAHTSPHYVAGHGHDPDKNLKEGSTHTAAPRRYVALATTPIRLHLRPCEYSYSPVPGTVPE